MVYGTQTTILLYLLVFIKQQTSLGGIYFGDEYPMGLQLLWVDPGTPWLFSTEWLHSIQEDTHVVVPWPAPIS